MKNYTPTEEDLKGVDDIASYIASRSFTGIDKDELFQIGVVALLQSAERYDKTKSTAKLFSFAYRRIRGAMLDFIGKVSVNGISTVSHKITTTTPMAVSYGNPTDMAHVYTSPYTDEDYEEQLDEMLEEAEILLEAFRDVVEKVVKEKVTPKERDIIVDYFFHASTFVLLSEKYSISRGGVSRLIKKFTSLLLDEVQDCEPGLIESYTRLLNNNLRGL